MKQVMMIKFDSLKWRMIDEYKVANPFIEVGFRQVKDVVDLRVFDLLNISRINNNRAEEMLLCIYHENKGNGYLLSVDGTPHCIAYWDTARDAELTGKAELICIHSLPENWHKGYGRQMMNRVLKDIKENGYSEVFLWVFRENYRARAFYEANGFALTDTSKPAFDTEEVLYSKRI